MKSIKLFFILFLISITSIGQKSFYDFEVETINGDIISLQKYAGKKIMIVNVASKCGLTKQYEALEKLYRDNSDKNFIIIAFPANNFLGQEPGTNAEIVKFCESNFGVTFPIMSKISVSKLNYKTYPPDPNKAEETTQHELYQWLTTKELNGVLNSDVQWNFQKFLINEQGELEKVISPSVSPLDEEITNWILEN
jgi:glutathione peroxidase